MPIAQRVADRRVLRMEYCIPKEDLVSSRLVSDLSKEEISIQRKRLSLRQQIQRVLNMHKAERTRWAVATEHERPKTEAQPLSQTEISLANPSLTSSLRSCRSR